VPFPPEKRAIEVGSVHSSYAKIERVLGWRPTVGLEEGLARMVAFYRQHRDHYWERPRAGAESPAGTGVPGDEPARARA
jgi:hypothetical protein